MSPRPDQEIELAFSLADSAAYRRMEAEIGAAPTMALRAIYFDTPDLALWRAGYALRVRYEDGKWVQTLKRGSAGGLIRGEASRARDQGSLDLRLLEAAGLPPALFGRSAELRPTFETHVERRIRLIRFEHAEIEIALDQGEVIAGALRAPICEFELELKAGEPSALFGLARRLSTQVRSRLTFSSKSDRGFALASGRIRHALPYEAPPAAFFSTADQAIGAIGGCTLHHLGANLDFLLNEDGGAETVRETIEGAERLRALISAVGSKDGDRRPTVEIDLGWLIGCLEVVKDIDRFLADGFRDLVHWSDDRQAAAFFGDDLIDARHAAHHELRETLSSERVGRMLIDAAELIAEATDTRADQSTVPFVRGVLQEAEAALRAEGGAPEAAEPVAIEQLRTRVKTLAYLVSVFGPALDRAGRAPLSWRRSLARLAWCLDDLHDVSIAPSIAKSTLDRSIEPDEDLMARAIAASGTIVIARLGKSKNTARYAQAAFARLVRQPSRWSA